MIGIIQKTLVECIHELGGDDLRRQIFREAGVPENRVFRMDESYPDDELGALLGATLKISGLPEEAVNDHFSRVFFRVINDVFPELISMAGSSEDLIRMQVKLHALIAAGTMDKGERKKVEDKFSIADLGRHQARVRYKSPLQLCGLYKSLAQAAANEFGDRIAIDTTACRKRGDGQCEFRVRWLEIAGKATEMSHRSRSVADEQIGLPG